MPGSRTLAELVESQVRLWEAEGRVRTPSPRLPCIALSRHPGAGAAEIGRRAAQLLDYGFFGTEIVDQIARELGVQRRLVAGLDERLRSGIDRYVADAFRRRAITETDYLRALVRTIATLGERGRAVILGRGAPFILPASQALRVLVVAPKEERVARLSRELGIPEPEAVQQIERRDAERQRFLRHEFKVDPSDPTLYDLVVNTGSLSVDACVALVVEALRRRFPSDRQARGAS